MTSEQAKQLSGTWTYTGGNIEIRIVIDTIYFIGKSFDTEVKNSHTENIGTAIIDENINDLELTIKWGDTINSKYDSKDARSKWQYTKVEVSQDFKKMTAKYNSMNEVPANKDNQYGNFTKIY